MNRELESICPRCKRSPDEPPAVTATSAPPVSGRRASSMPPVPIGASMPPPAAKPAFVPPSPPGYGKQPAPMPSDAAKAPTAASAVPVAVPHLRSRRQPNAAGWLLGIAGVAALVMMVLGGVVVMQKKVNSPEHKAEMALREGLDSLEAEKWSEAVSCCRESLKYDQTMAEASFLAGLAILQIAGEESASASIDRLLDEAKWGRTEAFDTADEWMRDCVVRCDKDLDRPTVDKSLVSNRRTKSCAQTYLFLTAIFRSAAAGEATQWKDQKAWLAVAEKHLKDAEATDSACPYVKDARELYDEVTAPPPPKPRQPWEITPGGPSPF
ncbi:MAG: hypothetical protein ACYC63_10410 [Armatimonadota bacterium]